MYYEFRYTKEKSGNSIFGVITRVDLSKSIEKTHAMLELLLDLDWKEGRKIAKCGKN